MICWKCKGQISVLEDRCPLCQTDMRSIRSFPRYVGNPNSQPSGITDELQAGVMARAGDVATALVVELAGSVLRELDQTPAVADPAQLAGTF